MKRYPAIHITANKLTLVFRQMKEFDNYDDSKLNILANTILKRARKFSLTNRCVVVDKAKLIKSTSRVVLSTRDDSSVFANLLTLCRRKKNHKGISIIKPGSRDWLMLKEITKLANDFCNDFQLKREEGYKLYINASLDKMTKFHLMKFNSLHQIISEDYEAMKIIELDMTPQQTQVAKNIYEKYLGEKGIVRDYTEEPSKFIFFIKAKEVAEKLGVNVADYIKSQFDGLEWANAIPDPSQLVGQKAIDRLNRYLIKNNIKPGSKDNKVHDLAAQIKEQWKNGNNKRK